MEQESSQPKPELDVAVSAPADPLSDAGAKRRALLRAGVGATPILLTLGSGPVSAMPCTVASSYVSARTFASRNAQATTMQCSNLNAYSWNEEARTKCRGTTNGQTCGSNWPLWSTKKLSEHLTNCPGTSDFDNEYLGWIMKSRVSTDNTSCAQSGPLAVIQGILGLTLTMQEYPGSIQTTVNNGGTLTKSYLATVWSQYKTSQKFVVAGTVAWTETDILRWLWLLQSNTPVSTMFT